MLCRPCLRSSVFIAGADVPVADSDTAPQNHDECMHGSERGHISESVRNIHHFPRFSGGNGQPSGHAKRVRVRKKTPAPVL